MPDVTGGVIPESAQSVPNVTGGVVPF